MGRIRKITGLKGAVQIYKFIGKTGLKRRKAGMVLAKINALPICELLKEIVQPYPGFCYTRCEKSF
jgi:hypothetical protein